MDTNEILSLRKKYEDIKHSLRTPRAYKLMNRSNHTSGKVVISTCIIPMEYSLDDLGGYIQYACVPTMEQDLTKWQKLVKQSSSRFKSLSLEEYLALPLWDNDMLSITSEVRDIEIPANS